MAIKLFHAADLHLSRSERDYSLTVLEELVYHCRRLGADAWLLCGDVFDTHADLMALADDFRAHLRELGEVPVLMIPGNHELSGGKSLADLGPLAVDEPGSSLRLLVEAPYTLHLPSGLDVEVLAVPFRRGYGDYPDWALPPRERRWRVGMLHGVVNGMSYTGESAESEHAVIDPDLFTRLGLHYAALGHIHVRGEARFGECLAHYPGSARVWRRGETGPRRASLVVLDDDGVRVEAVDIAAAGTYRALTVPLDEQGAPLAHDNAKALLQALGEQQGPQDWIRLELGGFVEARTAVDSLRRSLERRGSRMFRRFEVADDEVVEAERLRGHPLVRSFYAGWRRRHAEALAAGDEAEVALLERVRRLSLEQIHQRLAEQ